MNHLKTSLSALLFVVFCSAAHQALGHHSGAMYDLTKTETVEGVVTEFSWSNPHVTLWVAAKSKDNKPAKTWFISATSPGNLTRRGWTRTTFKPGDQIKVTFNPMRDGTAGGTFVRAILMGTGKEVTLALEYDESEKLKVD